MKIILFFIATCFSSSICWAAGGSELVDMLAEDTAPIQGTTHYAMVVNNAMVIGTLTQSIAPAGKKTKAAIQVTNLFNMKVGPMSKSGSEIMLINSDWQVVGKEITESDTDQQGNTKERSQVWSKHKKKGWKIDRVDYDGNATSATLDKSVVDFGSQFVAMAIVQLIKPSTQGSWTFATVKWNSGDEPTTSEVTLSAEGPGEVTVKGQSVQASMYRFVNGDEATVIAVGADSKILSVSLDGQPISMLPCATPACDQVIPETPQEAGSPVEVVVTFMEVMAKIKDVDSLDAIVDWNTVKTSMPGQENMQMVELETFKTMMKDVIRNTAKDMRLGADEIKLVRAMMQAEIDGDTAIVHMAGEGPADKSFTLHRVDGAWKFSVWPG